MPDELEPFALPQQADPTRPLLGMTVLVVEDSRFASEAIRLLCLRSGARIRRADTLAAAHRHLSVYRPSAVIVDLGLPDGSGADLIGELDRARPRLPAILGMSGDPERRADALAAGADGYVQKPIESIAAFQALLLDAMSGAGSGEERPRVAPPVVADGVVHPDPLSLQDDLAHMQELIEGALRSGAGAPPGAEGRLDYIAQFLAGVARTARDRDLEHAAGSLARARGPAREEGLAQVAGLIRARLEMGIAM